jgi:glycosyltransferase involved in cell wall biosynthesis
MAAATSLHSAERTTGGVESSPRQRIVMLLENFTYPQDTRVRNEAESLAKAGHDVLVIAPRGRGQTARAHLRDVDVRRYRTVWANGSRLSYAAEYGVAHVQLLLRSLARRGSAPWTVHFHGPPDTLAVAGALARLAGGSVVYDMHDSGPELFEAKFGASPATRALRMAQRAAIASADRVIVTNESQRELVVGQRPRSASRVTIVRNGPRLEEFPAPAGARPGILSAPKLVYVGTLDVQDGVLELPRLLAEPGLAQAHLTIVGEGGARAELERRCRQADVADRVTFTGRVAHEHVATLIGEADVAVDPAPGTALNHGSTMIKIAEYMACARPVVAYALRETRRTAGACALYAPCAQPSTFAELVARLADDDDLRLRLGHEARARALDLTWERSEPALLAAYDSLGGARPRKSIDAGVVG